jgi:hypothetical protein
MFTSASLLTAFAAFVVVFKPLLLGVFRAIVLVFNPRLSKEERRARGAMRDARMLQKMINNSQGPSHAAELRAMAARA